jgi:RimJ/RimL family protein N-acetyltransferase
MGQDHASKLDRLASAPDMAAPQVQPAAKSADSAAAQPQAAPALSMLIRLPLQGPRIQLTVLEAEDLPFVLEFFQDLSVLRYYLPTTVRPFNAIQVGRLLADWNDGIENYVFAIRCEGKVCGLFNLDGLDWPNGHAEIGIAITDKLARGKGLAGEALEVMLDYAFGELDLHRIWRVGCVSKFAGPGNFATCWSMVCCNLNGCLPFHRSRVSELFGISIVQSSSEW